MASERLLLVDDDETLRSGLGLVLEASGYDVTLAQGVPEALNQIASREFDVLLTDLNMPPGPGDGITVIARLRQAQPRALALLMSADPRLDETANGAETQPDEFFVKPVRPTAVAQRIRELLDQRAGQVLQLPPLPAAEDVAVLLDDQREAIGRQWLNEVQRAAGRQTHRFELTDAERAQHLPQALRDILFRLRHPQPLGVSTLFSMSALQHGARRRRQGAGASTLAEEARALQIVLFGTLEANRGRIDPAHYSPALMAIADEVNAQLLQALEGYEKEDPPEPQYGFR